MKTVGERLFEILEYKNISLYEVCNRYMQVSAIIRLDIFELMPIGDRVVKFIAHSITPQSAQTQYPMKYPQAYVSPNS